MLQDRVHVPVSRSLFSYRYALMGFVLVSLMLESHYRSGLEYQAVNQRALYERANKFVGPISVVRNFILFLN